MAHQQSENQGDNSKDNEIAALLGDRFTECDRRERAQRSQVGAHADHSCQVVASGGEAREEWSRQAIGEPTDSASGCCREYSQHRPTESARLRKQNGQREQDPETDHGGKQNGSDQARSCRRRRTLDIVDGTEPPRGRQRRRLAEPLDDEAILCETGVTSLRMLLDCGEVLKRGRGRTKTGGRPVRSSNRTWASRWRAARPCAAHLRRARQSVQSCDAEVRRDQRSISAPSCMSPREA